MLSRINLFSHLFSATLIILCVLPGYYFYGNLVLQILITLASTFFCLFIFDFLKIKAVIVSHSLIIMTIFWIAVALIKQIIIHINNCDFSFRWLHLFYYDRPALLFVVMFSALAFYIVKLFRQGNDYLKEYSVFLKNSIICLIIYYIIILIYCFILVRKITFIRPEYNLIPFYMIRETFSLSPLDYKMFFLFLGNIAIFLPLGVWLSALNCKKILLIIFPFILSVGIEISQYLLGNGHPDIDDVILNIFRFYLGVFLKCFADFLIRKTTKGKFNSVFIFN